MQKFNRIAGTSSAIGSGAAASAVVYTFDEYNSPTKVVRVYGTTPAYTNATNTTVFICQGTPVAGVTTVMWSGTATAKATVYNELVSGGKAPGDGVIVFPGDTIYAATAGDIGATGANTFTLSAQTENP